MRLMIACLALIAAAPLAGCAATADQTVAKAPAAPHSAFQASRARAVRDGNTAVDRSMRGG